MTTPADDDYPYARQRRAKMERILDLSAEVPDIYDPSDRDAAVDALVALLADREQTTIDSFDKMASEKHG
jgi:hypothetical protein